MADAIAEATDEAAIARDYLAAADRLRRHVIDGRVLVEEALARGDRVLLEGQLGTMRDIDWGVYPYVTSSSPIAGGASLGAGLPAVAIDRVLGIAKAYTTAVGTGPLPTELDDAAGEHLRERGMEFGASTGRPRRCGWYDAVTVRYSAQLAGYSSIALTKLDVLDDLASIPVCVAYRDPASGLRAGDGARVRAVVRSPRARLRAPCRLADRDDRLPLVRRAARRGPRLRRAPGGACRRPDQPRLGGSGA